MQEDTNSPLAYIRARYQGRLIPQLLKIQQQTTASQKSIEWADTLQCLYRSGSTRKRRRGPDDEYISAKILRRTEISALSNRKFVAVSYPWHPSADENPTAGGYEVQSLKREYLVPSEVRDVVWDRVITYAKHHGVAPIWIDRECIPQEDNNPQKEDAMNSMDIVYSRSEYPLGLLSLPIKSRDEINLLIGLLDRRFVQLPADSQIPTFKQTTDLYTAAKVVMLLAYITSDQWWERAWIFQEDYLSGTRMSLLIPHTLPFLGRDAREKFGNISGELQVNSVGFRTETTLFCIAYLQKCGGGWRDGQSACKEILSKAGSYKVLYDYSPEKGGSTVGKAMSSTIFEEIGRRKITNKQDIIPIAANSCGYSIRLEHEKLRDTGCSLSLCILALYLLNGEIMRNNERDEESSSRTIFEYLKHQSLDSFNPPVEDKELTFIKNCRFVNVRFSLDGILTAGRLWKLHKVLETRKFTPIPIRYLHGKTSSGGLNKYQRAQLQQLASKLEKQNHCHLAKDLRNYLKKDYFSNRPQDIPSKIYMDLMAEEVVEAIRQGEALQLGCLVGDTKYRGIFISNSTQNLRLRPSHAFTAWEPRKKSDGTSWQSYLDKYVSLAVDVVGSPLRGQPRLKTKEWVNGLCFFSEYSPEEVVFPWPASLKGEN